MQLSTLVNCNTEVNNRGHGGEAPGLGGINNAVQGQSWKEQLNSKIKETTGGKGIEGLETEKCENQNGD